MKKLFILLSIVSGAMGLRAQTPALLKHSAVVIQYKASHDVYTNYGVNVLAWGQNMTPKEFQTARDAGVKVFASVGVVTECGGFYDRFPNTYEQGFGRDLDGQPMKVSWLAERTHNGIPLWWCCNRNPEYRQFLRERVTKSIQRGAAGLHLDDHMGIAGAAAYLDLCFCDRCVHDFRDYLKALPTAELQQFHIEQPDQFDFRQTMKEWVDSATNKYERLAQHPLWREWLTFQDRGTMALTADLHKTASEAAGHPVPMCANSCLLVPSHLIDYRTMDFFSSETYHQADKLQFSDTPLFAYRLAESVHRSYAATARGVDWAVVKDHHLATLPNGWIAFAYAAGQHFMPPNRSWCFTPGKGTDWFHGDVEKFAPIYHFIHENAACFDDYETFTDTAIVLPYGSFNKDANHWFQLCNQLAAANLSYRLLVCGDGILDHPLDAAELGANRNLVFPDRDGLLPADRELIDQHAGEHRVFTNSSDAVAGLKPAVRIQASGTVRVFPRVKKGAAVVHLLNFDYDGAKDEVRALSNVKVFLDTKALGVPKASSCKLIAMDSKPSTLQIKNGAVDVPALRLWSLLLIEDH
jgi:hypothetical protein